jgi:LmbE family N-acetylglucosaminyl deacetylase
MEEGEPQKTGYYALLEPIEAVLEEFHPTEVVLPSSYDLNQDHKHLAAVCKIALRPANLGNVRRVLEAIAHDQDEGPGYANYAVELDDRDLETVFKAWSCYEDEQRDPPHVRSMINMEARYRFYGAMFGYNFAEPYRLVMCRE